MSPLEPNEYHCCGCGLVTNADNAPSPAENADEPLCAGCYYTEDPEAVA